jgi:hypothetical protein
MQQMTLAEYNNETQLYRDQIEMVWSSYEKGADRAVSILVQEMIIAGGLVKVDKESAAASDASSSKWLGQLAVNVLSDPISNIFKGIFK